MIKESSEPTPYATDCRHCGLVYMTKEWYREQMSRPDSKINDTTGIFPRP